MSPDFVNTQNHFFSDRTSLAFPSAFVRLGSFKRWSRYHTAMGRQQLFSKKFSIVCNPLSRNKMKTHFFLVFLLSASLPHPADVFPRTKRPRETTKIDAGLNKKHFCDIPYDSLIDLRQPGQHWTTFPRPSGGQPRPGGDREKIGRQTGQTGTRKESRQSVSFWELRIFHALQFSVDLHYFSPSKHTANARRGKMPHLRKHNPRKGKNTKAHKHNSDFSDAYANASAKPSNGFPNCNPMRSNRINRSFSSSPVNEMREGGGWDVRAWAARPRGFRKEKNKRKSQCFP